MHIFVLRITVFFKVEDFPRQEPPPKKPKSKPKIQDNIDVRELALQDQVQYIFKPT